MKNRVNEYIKSVITLYGCNIIPEHRDFHEDENLKCVPGLWDDMIFAPLTDK